MDSMDYSYHDSPGASSNSNTSASWHPASELSWSSLFSSPPISSSQPSPGLIPSAHLLFPSSQELSLAAFGYDFGAELSGLPSQIEPTMPPELFYPPMPNHSRPTGTFALSAHAVESASLAPQRDRGIMFQPRNDATLHRQHAESSLPHIQPSASVPRRGQSMRTPRSPTTSLLRSRYALSQPSMNAYGVAPWEPTINTQATNATSMTSMSPSGADEPSGRQAPTPSQTQGEQTSTAGRHPAHSRQASQLTSHASIPQRLHAPLHLAERRRLLHLHHQHHRNRPSAGGHQSLSEGSPGATEESNSSGRPSAFSPSRRERSSNGSTMQSARSARNYLAGSNKMLVPKWVVDTLEKVDVNELDENDRACVICYNDYHSESPEGNKEVPLRLPKCKHVFGSDCIRKWFEESDSCPYCRDKLWSDFKNAKGSGRAYLNLMRVRGWTGHDGTPEEVYRHVILGEPTDTSSRNRRSVGERRPLPENAEEQPRRTRQRLSVASEDESSDSAVYDEFRLPTVPFANRPSRSRVQNGPERPRNLPTTRPREPTQTTPGNNEEPSRVSLQAASTRIAPTRPPRSDYLLSAFNVSAMPNRVSNSNTDGSVSRHASQSAMHRHYSPRPAGLFPSPGDAELLDTTMLNPLDGTPMPNQLGALPMNLMSQRLDPMWQLHHGRQWI